MHIVLADGTLIVYGGKVMKNVAGFDLARLFIGSLGTLGVIGEATLRTFAEPEVRQTLVVSGLSQPEAAAGLAQRFLDLRLEQTALDILSPAEGRYAVLVRLEGTTEAVARQVRDFKAIADGQVEVADGVAQGDVWRLPLPGAHVHARLSLPLVAIGPVLSAVRDLTTAYGISRALQVHAGNGIVHLYFEPGERIDLLAVVVKTLRRRAGEAGGRLVLASGPVELKAQVGVWDRPGPEAGVMAALKTQFDPKGIMSPGRFIGGL